MSFNPSKISDRLIDLLLDISGENDEYTIMVTGIAEDDKLKELLISYIETIKYRGDIVDPQKVARIALYFAQNGEKAWKEYNDVKIQSRLRTER